MRTESPLAPWYVTGFLEGAGSFTFNRGAGRITLVFAVRTKRTNRALLERLRRFFSGAGRIYDTRRSSEPRATRGDTCLYRINRTRDLLRVVQHFDEFPLRGGRRKAFRHWREMVILRATHHGSRPPAEFERRAAKLARENRRAQPGAAPTRR